MNRLFPAFMAIIIALTTGCSLGETLGFGDGSAPPAAVATPTPAPAMAPCTPQPDCGVVIAPPPTNAVQCDGLAGVSRMINDDGTVAGIQIAYKAADGDWEFVRVSGVAAAHDLDEQGHAGQNHCVISAGPDKGKPVTTAALNAGVYNWELQNRKVKLPPAEIAKLRLVVPPGEGQPDVFCERFKRSDCELAREVAVATPTTWTATPTVPAATTDPTQPSIGQVYAALFSVGQRLTVIEQRLGIESDPKI